MKTFLSIIAVLILMGCTTDAGFSLIPEARAEEVPNHPDQCVESTHVWEYGVDNAPGLACDMSKELSCVDPGPEATCENTFRFAFQIPGIYDQPFPNLMVMPTMVCDEVPIKYLPDETVSVRILENDYVLITTPAQFKECCAPLSFTVRYCY